LFNKFSFYFYKNIGLFRKKFLISFFSTLKKKLNLNLISFLKVINSFFFVWKKIYIISFFFLMKKKKTYYF
jgi:hypothetical protein